MADAHKNFAISTVATAPSPAASGTSLVVAAGHGTRFPAVPFNATICPVGATPDPTNAEIVRVTNIATDTLTIQRTQESTSARTVIVGDVIFAAITAKTLTDVEDAINELDTEKAATTQKLDDFGAPDDNTDLNASTTAHGLALKVTAADAGNRNVHCVDNGETARKDAALFDATNPADIGTATPGTSLSAARRDHVHAIPSAHVTNTMLATSAKTNVVGIVIDGGGSAITTGVKGDIKVPFGCTITGAQLLADQSGSIVIDVWKDTLANYPPTDADSITASAPPTLSSATNSNDTTLTGWTTSISAGDCIRFNVDSATTVTRVTLLLTVTRT